jgi:hypothetical protein
MTSVATVAHVALEISRTQKTVRGIMARAKAKYPVKPTIIVDTREKPEHRLFDIDKADDKIAGYEVEKVDAGDYTIKEVPNLITIEKKQDGKELYSNFLLHKDRFMREVERMRAFKEKYILITQSLDEFYDPKKWTHINPYKRRFAAMSMVLSWLMYLAREENIHFVFIGKKNAGKFAKQLLLKAYETERKKTMERDDES